MITRFFCKQEGCKLAEDGKYLEGLDDIESCPHAIWKEEEESITDSETESQDKSKKFLQLFPGKELSLDKLNFLTYRVPTKTVIIVGESDSGKTTLLATIYDLFQIGKLPTLLFAGSITQLGFDQRCHLSRVSSNSPVAHTEKTKAQDLNFLHLAIKRSGHATSKATHLLISDISGELFQLASHSSSTMKELSILKFTDNILIIIDGAKLAKIKTKEVAILSMETFLRKAIDESLLTNKSSVNIAISKWDILSQISNFNLNQLEQRFHNSFSSHLKELKVTTLAARPTKTTNGIGFGYGIEELLEDWLQPTSSYLTLSEKNHNTAYKNERAFANFQNYTF